MAPTFCSETAKNGSLQNKVTEIQLPHINICKMQKIMKKQRLLLHS